ncbi:MAG: hypothetical protein II825_03580 [Paludibacteraceae bacterium]|nr:hypothetical protein [Paludibacteraceae bacterium]
MQKIMFNEQFGLQQATFDGTKTMTRRKVPSKIMKDALAYQSHHIDDEKAYEKYILDHAPYKVGEIVAIAQRYSQLVANGHLTEDGNLTLLNSEGWGNKMYVKAELMQRHIKMTGIKLEGLAGISDEDCLKEGIYFRNDVITSQMEEVTRFQYHGTPHLFETPYRAYKDLIDRLNKRGYFESNPLVYAYTYELAD